MDEPPSDEASSSPFSFRESRPGKVVSTKIAGHTQVAFCRHALDRMAQRRVTEKEVLNAIRKPTQSGLVTQPGRERVRRNRNSTEAVDVVYASQNTTLIVVTVIVTRRKRGQK